jgi:acyl-CoA dehydrogenase
MDIGDSPQERDFRAESARWLSQHAVLRDPAVRARQSSTDEEQDIHAQKCRDWQRVLYEGGWAGLTWPKRFGGHGGASWQGAIFAEEQAKYQVSTGSFTVAHGMVAPTLMAHGNDAQQGYLDAMLRGDEIWCQLFSEPEAGSDLANVATRAELDGNEWVVNGQKDPAGSYRYRRSETLWDHLFRCGHVDAGYRDPAAASDHRGGSLQRSFSYRRADSDGKRCWSSE